MGPSLVPDVAGTLTIVPDGLYADAEFKSGRVIRLLVAATNTTPSTGPAGALLMVSMPRTTFRVVR